MTLISKRTIVALSLPLALLLSTSAKAQAQVPAAGPPPDQQAMVQQMQQMMQTAIQNMQAKGIDPQQFFQQIMQNGGGPAEIQKQLIDQGIIDKDTMAKMQTTVQNFALNRIRQQLDVTDEEWSALQPLVQKVVTAQANLAQSGQARGGGGGMMGAFFSGQTSKVASTMKDLRDAVNDPATPPEVLVSKMSAYREARTKAADDLAVAQRDLVTVLTSRQEAVLSSQGLLP